MVMGFMSNEWTALMKHDEVEHPQAKMAHILAILWDQQIWWVNLKTIRICTCTNFVQGPYGTLFNIILTLNLDF